MAEFKAELFWIKNSSANKILSASNPAPALFRIEISQKISIETIEEFKKFDGDYNIYPKIINTVFLSEFLGHENNTTILLVGVINTSKIVRRLYVASFLSTRLTFCPALTDLSPPLFIFFVLISFANILFFSKRSRT